MPLRNYFLLFVLLMGVFDPIYASYDGGEVEHKRIAGFKRTHTEDIIDENEGLLKRVRTEDVIEGNKRTHIDDGVGVEASSQDPFGVKKKKRDSLTLREESSQVFANATYDATFKYIMTDPEICRSFLRAFIPDGSIKMVKSHDTHLRPFEEHQRARTFVNADNSKKVVKKINELLDEKHAKDDQFSISFMNKESKEVERVHGGEEFIKGLASIYGDILNSYPTPGRNSQVDLLCEVDDAYNVLVEVQVIPQDFWDKRALSYAASIYSRQLKEGQRWNEIKKVICINILGGGRESKPWPTKTGFSRLTFKNQDNVEIEDGIEVLQYPLYCEKLKDEAGKRISEEGREEYLEWLDLLERSAHKKEKDILAIKTKEVKKAYERLKMGNLPKYVEEEYEKQAEELFAPYSQHTEYLTQEAKKEGEQIGLEKGEQIGLEKGRTEEKIAIVRNLVESHFDNSFIRQITQMSEEDIERVRQSMHEEDQAGKKEKIQQVSQNTYEDGEEVYQSALDGGFDEKDRAGLDEGSQ